MVLLEKQVFMILLENCTKHLEEKLAPILYDVS